MRKILTRDGSETLYSEEYQETYHSVTGAVEEAFGKYVKPCKIESGMNVLDICFGLGLNSLAALHTAKEITITALEKDENVLRHEVKVPEYLREDYKKIRTAAENLYYKDDKAEIKVLLGDARETIKQLNEKYDAVFLDPFSPPKNPELWTEEFFINIKKHMKKEAILATYSCARKVRSNLSKAGFEVKDGPCVGRRSPSTIAIA